MSVDKQFSELIGCIYDAALDPRLWDAALKRCCDFVGGSSAALFWHDPTSETSGVMHECNHDPYYTQTYFEKYFRVNPLFPGAAFQKVGDVVAGSDIIPRHEMVETTFYKEWLAPQKLTDAIAVNLQRSETGTAFFAVRWHEDDGPIDDAARRRLELVTPHLQRAVLIGRLFDQKRGTETALLETLHALDAGVYLLSERSDIIFANRQGQTILDEGELLRSSRNKLVATLADADTALRSAVRSCQSGDESVGAKGIAVPLSEQRNNPWFAHVLPLTAGAREYAGASNNATAAVFIKRNVPDGPTTLEIIAQKYKLTGSEIRVFEAVRNQGSIAAIAQSLGISQATTKTHLHHIFQKCGAKRRSDLIKLTADFVR